MNYYHRYSGDYIKKTLDLVMVEDGAYTRLLDWMYANERPVPHGKRHIITRCQSPVERKAVDAVLDQFFQRDGDCWTHERTQETIDEARPRIEAAQANGKKGGRPKGSKKKPTGLFEENPDQTQSESSPYTIPHISTGASNDDIPPPPVASSSDPLVVRSVELAVLLRKRGANVSTGNPDLRLMAEGGFTDAEALTALETAQAQRSAKADTQPISAGYLLAICRGQRSAPAQRVGKPSRHTGFDSKDYSKGVTADGSLI